MLIEPPAPNARCANTEDRCSHPFGEHYQRFDGGLGCSHISSTTYGSSAPTDNNWGSTDTPCRCHGFILATYTRYMPPTHRPDDKESL